jgi:hypothetical protein
MHCVLPLKTIVYPSLLSSAVLLLGARGRSQSQVLPILLVDSLLVVVLSSLGLVRSIILCPLVISVIKKVFLSPLLSSLCCLSTSEHDPGCF